MDEADELLSAGWEEAIDTIFKGGGTYTLAADCFY